MRLLPFIAMLALLTTGCGSSDGPRAAVDSGVEGLVVRGPLCPVLQSGVPCPDEPHEADVRILTANGDVVATVHTDKGGRFVVKLEPGGYVLVGVEQAELFFAKPVDVVVKPHAFTRAVVVFDTGIR
jgi:hypothetical protein